MCAPRRELFEGPRKPTPTRGRVRPSAQASPQSNPKITSKFDESSFVQRGPIPRLFYIRHQSTILQPQFSGRSAWGGLGALTGVNAFVLILWSGDRDDRWMLDNLTTDITNLTQGRPWSLVAASVSHIDPTHFAGNVFAMWLFGFHTCRVIGTAAFFGLYFAGGLACSATHVAHNVLTGKTQPPLTKEERGLLENYVRARGTLAELPPDAARRLATADTPALGASGSVMAISAATAALFPLDHVRLRALYLPLPIAVGVFVLSDLAGLTSEGGQVDHAGHLDGLIMGAVYVTSAWNSQRGAFRFLRSHPTGGELPIIYRLRQLMGRQ